MAPHLGGMRDTVSICEHTHSKGQRPEGHNKQATEGHSERRHNACRHGDAVAYARPSCATEKCARTTQSRKQQFTMG